MVRAGDDHALGVAYLLGELLELPHVAVLVLRAMEEQDRFLAGLQVAEVVLFDRRADEKDGVDIGQLAGHARGYQRAEGAPAPHHLSPGHYLHPPPHRSHYPLVPPTPL